MENKTKIIIGVVVPLILFGGYWFVVRNRQPVLNLEDTDWINNIAKVKFGMNTKSIPLGNNGEMNAGSTFSDKYKLEFTSDKKNIIFYVKDKEGYLIEKQTLDFGAKIQY